MKNSHPTISVLLPVYNGEDYIQASIESILTQTYTRFELLILDDCSTDSSLSQIRLFSDPRIRVIQNNKRMGLAMTLNKGIREAGGIYIARQDQDDISYPKRLEKQMGFFKINPACGLLGAWAEIIGQDIQKRTFHRHSESTQALHFDLLFDNPFVHSSVIIPTKTIKEVGGYSEDEQRQPPEDYELWSRIARKYEINNMNDVLILYRKQKNSMSHTHSKALLKNILKISVENISPYVKNEDPNFLSFLYHNINSKKDKTISINTFRHQYQNLVRNFCQTNNIPKEEINGSIHRVWTILRTNYSIARWGKIGVGLSQFLYL